MAGMFSKAPWASLTGSSHEHKAAKAEEADGDSLTTILSTAEDRGAFTILVADCTEVMRQSISDVFEAAKVDRVDEKPTEQPLIELNDKQAAIDASGPDDTKQQNQQPAQDLDSPKMQELKSAALNYFDDWRGAVIQRVGEIVNSKETSEPHADDAQSKTHGSDPSSSQKTATSKYDEHVEKTLRQIYRPVDNSLRRFDESKRALIVHSVLLLLLSLEKYQSYSRTLLLHLTTSLDLSVSFLAQDEEKIASGLLTAAEHMKEKTDSETKKSAEANQDSRKWKVGLATVGGAVLIGVTGGLAAPLLAAGVGSVMGGVGLGATAAAGYLGTLAGSGVLVGGLFGAYGGKMTGKMMDQYAREVSDFAFVPVRAHSKLHKKDEKELRRLRVAIGISGWLTDKDEVVEPWRVVGVGLESFALRWELEALMNLGNSMTTMVTSAAWGYAKKEIIKRTIFASLMAGLWPLGLLKVSRIVDNPWSVANYRAQKAGEVLADALINKAQGERPVTLVGYSLGAKVIYVCLQRLAERRAFGLVENAVMLGAPTPSTAADWRVLRTVVSGRVVNAYSTNDYILGFLYRSSSIQFGVAGLQAIEGVKGVENVDVSDLVSGHLAYRFLTGTILKKIGFEDVDSVELEREERKLQEEEAKKQSALAQSQKGSDAQEVPVTGIGELKVSGKDQSGGGGDVSEQQVKDLEAEIEVKNQQSYIGWVQEGLVSTSASAQVAYEKAKLQWATRGDASKAAVAVGGKPEGADTDASYESLKARSDARKAGGAAT